MAYTISGIINTISNSIINTISGDINTISGNIINTINNESTNIINNESTNIINNKSTNITKYYNEIIYIIQNNMDELYIYDTSKIINTFNKYYLQILISNLVRDINIYVDNKINNYKFQHYIVLFNFIYKLIYEMKKHKNIIIDYSLELLEKTSYLIKGVYILNKHKNNFIHQNSITDYNEIFKKTSMYGTLPTFLFWLNIIKLNNINNINTIFISSINNSDERIFKYILTNKLLDITNFFSNSEYINYLLVNLLTCNNIPRKYKLKRLKYLYTYVDFKEYYNYMIEIHPVVDIVADLTKYYYNTELDFYMIKKIILMYEFTNYDRLKDCQIIYNLLKTTNEKNIFALLYHLKGLYNINNNIVIVSSYYNILDEYYSEIIELLEKINYTYNNSIRQDIINYLYINRYFNKYLNNNAYYSFYHLNIYIYTRFYIPLEDNPNLNFIIQLNKCLHYLRMYIKKRNKNKINNFKINFNPIMNELINFEPNNKFKILNNGSINYNLNKLSFNYNVPRHLYPNEINIYNNFLIKQKADGILINNLPLNIYPYNDTIEKYEIKAEYIEELDLYLIFDINIPKLNMEERYITLRNMHPYTKNTNINIINNIDELNEQIIEENNILSKFIKENSNIKWYPKASWKVNNINKQFITDIIDIINENKIIVSGVFNCDGLILSPLNGMREIKIKPKSLMTIDLYYDGINWKDNDNIVWNDIIINKELPQIINKIYRCYPTCAVPLQYEYREIRYDKKNPNPNKIVDMITCLYLLNWNETNNFYYKNCKKILDKNIINILNNQKDYFIQTLNNLNPQNNMIWLDLGCGKCKFFELIKMIYKPKKYIGIDIDTSYLAKAIKYQDDNPTIVELYNINLKNDWNSHKSNWGTFNYSQKVNYIFANFSLMHFNTDIFWEELNKIVIRGTKFIFNIVKDNISWEYNNSILYTENDKVYYNFEWVHDEIQSENIINKNDIMKYLIKYEWKIISIYENNNNDFSKLYNWYIIEKI